MSSTSCLHNMQPCRTTPRWTRSRSGCSTCRQRRKKCDETKPTCKGCERNHLLCHWPPGIAIRNLEHHEEDAIETSYYDRSDYHAPNFQAHIASTLPLALIFEPDPLPQLFTQLENQRLLAHYTTVTANRMAGKACPSNPFLKYNLLIAGDNELMQHCILAISSSHLFFSDPNQGSVSWVHYAVVLRGIKHAITRWRSSPASDQFRLLSVVMATCWFEVIDVNTKGALYDHLRASRRMLSSLQSDTRAAEPTLLGFLEEQYAYLALVSNIGFLPEHLNRYVDRSLPSLSLRRLNEGTDNYGCLFGCSHQLFESISHICDLAAERRKEGQQPSISSSARYLHLLYIIDDWTPEIGLLDDGLINAGYMYQQACLIFLHTSFHGPYPPTPSLTSTIEPMIRDLLKHFTQLSYEAASWTTVSWPCFIAGSCMQFQAQREQICQVILRSTIRMRAIQQIIYVLRRLWAKMDANKTLYGPYGLEEVLRMYNINPCIG